jgi:hypothetical protein
MRFENGPVKYEIDFQHRKEKMLVPPTAAPEKQKEREVQITTCAISVNDSGNVTQQVSAHTICRPPDQFSKPLGRKLALTRALKISGLKSEDKEFIWEQYIKSLDTKRMVIAGFGVTHQGLLFIQTPTKDLVKATKAWQSYETFKKKTGHGAHVGAVPACPLPMDHPFFSDPDKYGFKKV